jgi:two-component system sensor histidine kinase/response regulator
VVGLEPGQRSFRVLAVDDQEDNRAFLEALLTSVGFEVRVVGDGAQVLGAFEAWSPQLVLMDMRMPVMGGEEAIRRLRRLQARDAGAGVKILALTASAFLEDRHKAIEAGADDFLSKPFREEVLFEKLSALLGVRYRYAGASDGAAPLVVAGFGTLQDGVARLAGGLVESLREAALRARRDRVLQLAAEVDETAPEVARELRRLATGFSYDRILELLQGRKGDA